MASILAFGVILCFMFIFSADINANFVPKVFDVMSYGAVADGKTDNSQAFFRAWIDACHWQGGSRMVLIPRGTYMLHLVRFFGPCNGDMIFRIQGVIKAPTIPALFFTDTWIAFQHVDELTVEGGGFLDGQGGYAWPYNDCAKNPHCLPLPVTMRFDFITNSRIRYLRFIDSKSSHISLFANNNINISHIEITAPESSHNTDGIRIGSSSNVKISNVAIGTGDDCIAMIMGSKNIDIFNVTCGPGHGISIGSLGKSLQKEYVTGINVWNSSFHNTQNGVRIKTWAPSLASVASDITFGNLFMENVNNPIIIDQHYCPTPPCGILESLVQIRGVTFRNIWGTSSSKVAVTLQCSKLVPCKNVKLVDINLIYNGLGGPATSSCSNANGNSYGKQLPPGCF